MNPLFSPEQLSRFEKKEIKDGLEKFIVGKTKAAQRKEAIQELERITGIKKLWKWFSFPYYIKTEWIESFKEPLILHYGNKGEKLFELIKESQPK